MGLIIGKKRLVEKPEQMGGTESRGAAPERTAAGGGRSDTVRISFRMARDLHRRLKLEAVRRGRTILGMLEGFVAEHTPLA